MLYIYYKKKISSKKYKIKGIKEMYNKNIGDYLNNSHINQNNSHNAYDLSKPKETIKEEIKTPYNQNIEYIINDLKKDLIDLNYEHIYKIDNIIKLIK